jgi:tripartite-type tricarboxylate transporter receptor subunit TctC
MSNITGAINRSFRFEENTMKDLRAAAIVALALFTLTTYAHAIDYPAAPVRIIVPYPAGGLVDIVMRIVGDRLSQELGQQFTIESRAGAGGTIATASVARAEPDGYTLLAITDSHTTNRLAFKDLPYDSIGDFAPIGLIGHSPLILIVHPSVPARSVQEFIALAKQNAATPLSYGSIGYGSASHLAGEIFKARAGVALTHIPYKGGAPAVNDLVAGQINSMFLSPIVSAPHIKKGTLIALGVAAPERFPSLPNVVTMKEAGVPMEAGYWVGLVAPAKTPAPVVSTLEQALARVLEQDDVRSRLTDIGLVVTHMNAKAFGDYIVDQTKFWKDFTQENGIKFD